VGALCATLGWMWIVANLTLLQISHHVVAAQEGEQRLHQVGKFARAALDDFPVNRLRFPARPL
jgi:hypothetical protein